MRKEIGLGALAVVLLAIALIFVPALDAVMRRQAVREVEQLCEKIVRRGATEDSFGREQVRGVLEERAAGVRARQEDAFLAETWSLRIGVLPWGASHMATIRILYDGEGRIYEVVPMFPEDLR